MREGLRNKAMKLSPLEEEVEKCKKKRVECVKEVLVGTKGIEAKKRKSSKTPQKGEEEQDKEEVLESKKKRLRNPRKSCRKV